jgi:mono/diheme cytochrome c family protein
MLRALPLLCAAALAAAAYAIGEPHLILHSERSSPGDLEVGGELAGLPAGSTRYLRYEDLLALPQESYVVTDDTNFPHGTRIEGVALGTVARLIARAPDTALIVAICYDKYRTNYPRDYLAAHHPVLVLRMNGELRDRWPPSEYGGPLGPYLISHSFFKPAFQVLSHPDEPQIPFGVTRIEFRNEDRVFGAIRPRGTWAADSPVAQGFIIARQDCFRCHNSGAEGGTMAGRTWLRLAAHARANPAQFRAIIHDPASVTPGAKMPAHGDYDEATLDALTAYFKAFKSTAAAHPDAARKATP